MNQRPIIGWESESPVPEDTYFTEHLHAKNGHLYFGEVDLMGLFEEHSAVPSSPLPSPLEVVYLPVIRQRIEEMKTYFAEVIEELGYENSFTYTYASKANAAEEVIRTTLSTGINHEMSSSLDVNIALKMIDRGLLSPEQAILCNGFKAYRTEYADNIVKLQRAHGGVIPIIEDLSEVGTFIKAKYPFEVGIRQKTYGSHSSIYEMDRANSRFGMDRDDVFTAADMIDASPNLQLTMYHGMVGSQLVDTDDFIERLIPPVEMYARLRQQHDTLRTFNFGGGMPVRMTLDFDFDYKGFIRRFLTTVMEICAEHEVPVPEITGEFGRYTTAEHGAHVFEVITSKENNSKLPWYVIDGSIMSSFPDSWALSEHFIVLPLNHLDKPFKQVNLGGITCDSDDVYPPKPSNSPLYLPVETEGLRVGFFSIGAYQEMLGGVRGSKHCVLPEAYEVIIDVDEQNGIQYEVIEGQTADEVLGNLGYS